MLSCSIHRCNDRERACAKRPCQRLRKREANTHQPHLQNKQLEVEEIRRPWRHRTLLLTKYTAPQRVWVLRKWRVCHPSAKQSQACHLRGIAHTIVAFDNPLSYVVSQRSNILPRSTSSSNFVQACVVMPHSPAEVRDSHMTRRPIQTWPAYRKVVLFSHALFLNILATLVIGNHPADMAPTDNPCAVPREVW